MSGSGVTAYGWTVIALGVLGLLVAVALLVYGEWDRRTERKRRELEKLARRADGPPRAGGMTFDITGNGRRDELDDLAPRQRGEGWR